MISDEWLTASTEIDEARGADRGRLNLINGGWSPDIDDVSPWYEVNMGSTRVVTGVITQGRYQHDNWVTQYYITWSLDGQTWNEYTLDAIRKVDTVVLSQCFIYRVLEE